MVVIRNKTELRFYLMADRMMNRGCFRRTFLSFLKEMIVRDDIMDYLVSMRKYNYYRNKGHIFSYFYGYRFRKLGLKLGFSINYDSLGYGVSIPHYGTIVVGSNDIGNYAVLHTSTCISGNGKRIGNGLYLSAGAKITSQIILGDNVSIAANSVVNKSFPKGNCLLAGAPAEFKKEETAWYLRDGQNYRNLVAMCEVLKSQMKL